MTTAGVSYVVPVYNKSVWLPRVLAAIAAQTGAFEREYIFVDDGSTDGSIDIVKDLTKNWTHVKIHSQDNHGSAHATNQGIKMANMEFVKFVDADDLLATTATQTLLDALRGTDACLAYGNVFRYKDIEEVDLEAQDGSMSITQINKPLIPALRNSLFNPTQFMARLDYLREAGGCDERVVHPQEYSLTLRLARLAPFLKVDASVAYLPEFVEGSLGVDQARQLRRVTLAVANFVQDFPDLPAEVKAFACRRMAGRAWKFQKRNRKANILSPWFWRYMRTKVSPCRDVDDFLTQCVKAYN